MPRSTSSVRIGEAERAAAERALRDHMNAGRLGVEEYAERSAAAANATTASEIAGLFTDLPGPRPKLPGSPLGGRGILTIVGAVVVVAVVGLIASAVNRGGRSDAAPSPDPVVAPTPTFALPVVPAVPEATSPVTPSVEPPTGGAGARDTPSGSGTVRRTTGGEVITLRQRYGVDLDDDTSPNWNVGSACCGRDVGFASNANRLYLENDHVVVTGPAQYATCSRETGYTNSAIERGSLRPGETICVRTTGERYALITIASANDQAVQFRATVWDPPAS